MEYYKIELESSEISCTPENHPVEVTMKSELSETMMNSIINICNQWKPSSIIKLYDNTLPLNEIKISTYGVLSKAVRYYRLDINSSYKIIGNLNSDIALIKLSRDSNLSYSIVSGTLPSGITLELSNTDKYSQGDIHGTPTQAINTEVVVEVLGIYSSPIQVTISFEISNTEMIINSSINSTISTQMTISGNYSVNTGSQLPTGITLSSTNGITTISGSISTPGIYNTELKINNSGSISLLPVKFKISR